MRFQCFLEMVNCIKASDSFTRLVKSINPRLMHHVLIVKLKRGLSG